MIVVVAVVSVGVVVIPVLTVVAVSCFAAENALQEVIALPYVELRLPN